MLALELLVIFLFKWCADFVEKERIEQNAIAGIKKPQPISIKQVAKEVIKEVQTPSKAPKAAARVEVKQLELMPQSRNDTMFMRVWCGVPCGGR